MTRRFLLLGTLPLLFSCGYRVGNLYDTHSVRLNLLDSQSERRTHEFDLTTSLSREFLAAGIQVNSSDAEQELQGEIVDFRQPTLVVDDKDIPIVGTVMIRIRMKCTEPRTGRILWEEEHEESAAFSASRAESPSTARQEVFDRLARWVVSKFETNW